MLRNAQTIAEALGGKRVGKSWMAPCPAHDDRNPSLSIDENNDGRVLIRCHAELMRLGGNQIPTPQTIDAPNGLPPAARLYHPTFSIRAMARVYLVRAGTSMPRSRRVHAETAHDPKLSS